MKESKSNKGWLSLGAIGLFFLGKMKWLFALLKIAKVGSLISIFVSLGAYALVYGWKFALALVYLIYIHEMGHLLAAKRKGIKTSNAIFIPFVGALIALKEEPKNANQEAYLAFGGPLLGTLAFLPAIPLFMMTENPFWLLVITLGAMINLFNLMPVHPLRWRTYCGSHLHKALGIRDYRNGCIFVSPSKSIFNSFLIIGYF